MEILRDTDIDRVPIHAFFAAISEYVAADFQGRATSLPRQSANFPSGKVVFTTGGFGHLAGFRAYETFDSDDRLGQEQIVAVWDTRTCLLKGLNLGSRLGAIRTGVLGGIAVDALAPASASICALIGTGLQAETQLLGILVRRRLAEVRVYSRQKMRRDQFVERMKAATPARMVATDNPEDAAAYADIVVLATDSETPVVDPAALENAAHITTVGPKFRGAHELPLDAVADQLIVSDSPQQIRDQGQRHMLFEHPCLHGLRHLGEVLSIGRPPEPRRSLYLSAGLAGTEVVALDTALEYRRGQT